ncbi:AraC family transcriptional regulator [Sphingomonas sp. PB1R3]|uniref:AraC family transcriptional regulator n=1 Tax=Sphingomonas flavida TaxID=3096154 RepID=UPI002FC9ADB9
MTGRPPSIRLLARDYPAGWIVGPHCHAEGQLVHAVAGVMEVRTASRLWLVPPQRAVWIPPRVSHEMRTRGPVSLRTLYVDDADLASELLERPRGVGVTPLMRALILRAIDYQAFPVSPRRERRLHDVIHDELACLPADHIALPIATDPRLQRACDMMLADTGQTLSLVDIARRSGLSIRTLGRLAHSELKCSASVWRQQARIVMAVPLIVEGQSVMQVASATGYETPGAFAAMFKRIVGVTPSAFGACRSHIET